VSEIRRILLFVTILVSPVPEIYTSDLLPPTVEPGQSLTNDTAQDIYIVIKLHPEDSFENSTADTALVFREAEFLKRFYYYKMHSRTGKYDVGVKVYEKLLQELDSDIDKIRKTK